MLVMERYRFHADGALCYVTFSVVDWLPIFISETACQIVTESLDFCHRQKGLRVNAYVIMPTHLHAMLFHADFQAQALEQVVTDFRKFTGRRLADFCAQHLLACFQNVLCERAGSDRDRRLWQPTRHPVQIETENFWQAKIDYLPQNPVRKGLVRETGQWRFSSASYWASGGKTENDVLLSAIGW
jgi:REP element-mobilizing transposase RayT